MIKELGGESAWQKFVEQVEDTEHTDRERLTEGLHVGRAVDSRSASEGAGNFLVRGVLARTLSPQHPMLLELQIKSS